MCRLDGVTCENIGVSNFLLNLFQVLVMPNVRSDVGAFVGGSLKRFCVIRGNFRDSRKGLSNGFVTQDTVAARVSGTQKS